MRQVAVVAALSLGVGCGRIAYDPIDGDGSVDVGTGRDGPKTISGAESLNYCQPLGQAAGDLLVPTDTAGFTAGGLVLVHQAQDRLGASGMTAPVTDPGTAGRWEVSRVVQVSGQEMRLEAGLRNDYDVIVGRAQVCTVPEYTDVTITPGGMAVATPWNGGAGGVVAFFATGDVVLEGSLTARGAGFRGGAALGNSSANSVTAFDTADADGGGKGEGIDPGSLGAEGRGSLGNAAGGGNAHNAGGGGGGNGGAGGTGGKQNQADGDLPETSGQGGGSLVGEPGVMLAFGGGGGSGQQNDDGGGTGGDGGGIVFVSIARLAGQGTIDADGGDGGDGMDDGGGGGGAGGTLLLRVAAAGAFAGNVSTRGGGGGDSTAGTRTLGPGGGGGGGRAELPSSTAAQLMVAGGAPGLANGVDPWGAVAGATGTSHLR